MLRNGARKRFRNCYACGLGFYRNRIFLQASQKDKKIACTKVKDAGCSWGTVLALLRNKQLFLEDILELEGKDLADYIAQGALTDHIAQGAHMHTHERNVCTRTTHEQEEILKEEMEEEKEEQEEEKEGKDKKQK